MQYPITRQDEAFEQQIAQSPQDFAVWLRYIEFVQGRQVSVLVFVLQRACVQFPRSYKLWKALLDLRCEYFGKFHLQHTAMDSDKLAALEYTSILNLYRQALQMLSSMPRLWLDMLQFMLDYSTDLGAIRRGFDDALQSLPYSQHNRIWDLYLVFANTMAGPKLATTIWRRYCMFDPSKREDCADRLILLAQYKAAASILVDLLNDPKFVSSQGHTRQQIWNSLADIVVRHDCGVGVTMLETGARMAHLGDQGALWVKVAAYHVVRGQLERARDTYEHALSRVLTAKDFAVVFDNYVQVEESHLRSVLSNDYRSSTELSADLLLKRFEILLDRRPFLLNDVSLRQNPNNVEAWEARIELCRGSADAVNKTASAFEKAVETVDCKVAKGASRLWIEYAKFYESHDNMVSAETIFDKATKMWFTSVDELVSVWNEWAEMQLRRGDFDRAKQILAEALKVPLAPNKIGFFDDSIPPQKRVFKSLSLWQAYIDIVEADKGKEALAQLRTLYDRTIELKIASMATFLNYALLLEQHNYFEDAFKVYETGVAVFSYPSVYELWLVYLSKAVSRKLSIDRLRDLFEQALATCPADLCKPIYIMYGGVEEDRGLLGNAFAIYAQACEHVEPSQLVAMYQHYIARAAAAYGLEETRPIYEKALDKLDSSSRPKDLVSVGLEFADMELQLGQIARARAIYEYIAQFPDNRVWDRWHSFEVENGSEATYKNMLRAKRAVEGTTAGPATLLGFVKGGVVNANS